MTEFVKLEIESDSQTLTDNAVLSLEEAWDGYEPNDGDTEIVLLEIVGDLVSDVASDLASMPSEALIQYGIQLLGLTYDSGVPAGGEVTFTLTDDDGHTIPAGFEIDIDGFAFQTDDITVVAPGDTVAASVDVTANEPGVEFNALAGSIVTPVSASTFVASIALDAPTSGGTDLETRDEFLDDISRELTLRGRTLVTWRDFEEFALDLPTIGRSVAVGNTAREVLVVVVQEDGTDVSGDTVDDLEDLYEEFRQVNTVYNVRSPWRTPVSVTATVKAEEGVDLTALEDLVEATLSDYLDPANWGVPKSGLETARRWVNTDIVRKNKLIDVIGSVEGVDYVDSITLTGGSIGSLTGTASDNTFARFDHGLSVNDRIQLLTKTGGTGLSTGVTYFVISAGLATNAFRLSATEGGSEIDFTTDLTAATYKVVVDANGDLPLPGTVPLTSASPAPVVTAT
jgi:hypothetical protein